MALIKCPECEREISNKAVSCPHCGAPIKGSGSVTSSEIHGRGEGMFMKSMNCGCMIILAVLGLAAAIIVYDIVRGKT